MKLLRIFLPLFFLITLSLWTYFPGRKKARAHVNYITAVDDHPLLCTSCHIYTKKSGLIARLIKEDYYSPFNMAVSRDGGRLYVVAEEGDALLEMDTEKRQVTRKISVGNHPHSIIIDKKGKTAFISNQWSDNVSVIDLDNMTLKYNIKTGNGPAGLALSSDERFLYVVNSYSSDLSVIDLQTGIEIKRLTTGNNPTGIGLSPSGRDLIVTSRRAAFAQYGEPLVTELTFADGVTGLISKRIDMLSAYMMENVDFVPEGDLAFVTLIRPKNLVPSIQVERGFMMTHGIGIIEMKEDGRIIQLLLDEPNSYYADPFDIVITPDGKKAFISNSGVNIISVVSIDSVRKLIAESSDEMLRYYSNHLGISYRYVTGRIPTGANPKGLALSPDGKILYTAERLEDRIRLINTDNLQTIGSIDLGGPKRITVARQGRKLLNNAGHTFQNQYSCYTCHPDEHEDGLIYNMASKDMGRNLTNTQSLRDIGDTPPFKWNGKNHTIYKQDGMRFSTVLTRTEPFSHKDLDALVAYIVTGIKYPPNNMYNTAGELTAIQQRGKVLFERTHDNFGNEIPLGNRCITCHPPPYFTNLQMADVGTLLESDDTMLFDTPHLNNIYASPPYLHHGLAATLEEIWTRYSHDDKHGVVNDMTKIQLNELIEYLRSLSSPDKYHENSKKLLPIISKP